MRIPIYQADAFTDRVFGGNPAAVCPLDSWPDDALLQAIAAENNLAETAFFVREGDAFRLRWFTPATEVELCGHATLATAFLLFERLEPGRTSVRFDTWSGPLLVRREGELLVMDFPALERTPCVCPPALAEALGEEPREVYQGMDYMAVIGSEESVRRLRPDMRILAGLGLRGVIVTAPGEEVDFVSRFFAPGAGIDEDPVTGSAHCMLTPYWAERLGKNSLRARQLSPRGGEVLCELRGERVLLSGRCAFYLEGTIEVPG